MLGPSTQAVDTDLQLISSTNVDWLAWSPDGTRIVAIQSFVSTSGNISA
jgi:hypothetical protein